MRNKRLNQYRWLSSIPLCCVFLYFFMYLIIQSRPKTFSFGVRRYFLDLRDEENEECLIELDVNRESQNSSSWCACLKNVYPTVLNLSSIGSLEEVTVRYNVVNPFSARLIHNSSDICSSSKEIYLLNVVKSRAENKDLRLAIRKTWGREATSVNTRLIFLLGYPREEETQRKIHSEHSVFRDIVLGDFMESYYNNTLKTMMGIHWISTFCPTAKFVFFVDDDIMVNFQNLLAFYKNVSLSREMSLYSGNLKVLEKPVRHKKDKWYISIDDFPFHCYPSYISGAAILTSGFVVKMLNNVIPYVERLKYDDVYVAIVLQKFGILPQKNDRVLMKRTESMKLKDIIACHGFTDPSDYINTYKRTITE